MSAQQMMIEVRIKITKLENCLQKEKPDAGLIGQAGNKGDEDWARFYLMRIDQVLSLRPRGAHDHDEFLGQTDGLYGGQWSRECVKSLPMRNVTTGAIKISEKMS